MVQNKRIFLVNFSTNWGGGEVQHFELAKEFIKQGHNAILVLKPNSALKEKAQSESIPFYEINVGKYSFLSPLVILGIKKIINFEKPNAIILNSSLELKHFAIATSRKKHNLIYRRGFHFPIKTSLLNKFLFRRLTQVVANSEFIKNSTLADIRKYCKKEPIVIHNGIPISETANADGKKEAYTIIAIGRLVKYKQFDVLIKAMQDVIKSVPKAKLWILGEGPEKAYLESLALTLNLEKHVDILGFKTNINDYISRSSVLVHPAIEEAFGVVFLEAMNKKTACIAFKGHAANEIILDGQTGTLIEEMTPKALAQGISELLSNTEKLIRFGKNGEKHFLENFTITTSAEKYIQLL